MGWLVFLFIDKTHKFDDLFPAGYTEWKEDEREENKWRKMTINFFLECVFVSCFFPPSLLAPSLPIVRFQVSFIFKNLLKNLSIVVALINVWLFKSKSFHCTNKRRFWWNWTQIGTNWCYNFREKLVGQKKRARKAPKVGLKAILLRMPMSINYRICRQTTKDFTALLCNELESPFAVDGEFHAKFSWKKRNSFNLNNKRKGKTSHKAHNDLIYSFIFSSPSFLSRESVRIFRYLKGSWKFF